MHHINAEFWENPPWGDGKEKYRLGLNPISKGEWLNRKISPQLLKHKKHLFVFSLKLKKLKHLQ